MRYEIIGASVFDIPYEEDDDLRNAQDERRAEEIDDAILDAIGTGEAVIRLTFWDGCHDDTLMNGSDRYMAWRALQDGIEALAIKEGVDMVRFENGNLGLVAYYGRHKSYLEFITDKAEVARLKETFMEEDEE